MSSQNPLREFKIAVMAESVLSQYLEAKEHPTEKAKKKYLKDHPNADPKNHWVKKPKKDKGESSESSKTTLNENVDVPKPPKIKRRKPGKGTPPKDPKKASRVGVPGKVVPPPPKKLPRMKNLSPEEAMIEKCMNEIFESDPDGAAKHFLENFAAKDNWVFETDRAKEMLPGWSRPDLAKEGKGEPTNPERADFRGRYNALLHQAANAIVKRAFMSRLDEIAKMPEGQRTILVTSGGVAAGKGMALKGLPGLAKSVQATWDAAGEQNATENEWLMEECEKRGIKPTFMFVAADPIKTWQGVVDRAKGQGRMVDAQLFADSYATGARNFKDFYEKNKGKANFFFGALDKDDNGKPLLDPELDEKGEPKKDADGKPIWKKDKDGKPALKPARMMNEFPDEALKYTTEEIYANASKKLDEAYEKGDIGEHIYNGGTAGRRLFQDNPEKQE